MLRFLGHAALAAVLLAGFMSPASAQDGTRFLEFSFTPTKRVQMAIWIEDDAGNFVATVRLTEAVALRGIGNRPGAMQMNTGYRWPFGRREGVLPVWAHRRAAAPGAELFPRIIFQERNEGHASNAMGVPDSTRDDYYCLSFVDNSSSLEESLDAVTCASVFNSDKGRYLMPSDVTNGYAEPFVDGAGANTMRALGEGSLYPPRRDSMGGARLDHADVPTFAAETERVMPDIDAVTMATPAADQQRTVQFSVPQDWVEGDYVAWLEVHREGDYNNVFNETTFPTPVAPQWDVWAIDSGYPGRGQPSVVYRLPFELSNGGSFSTDVATGYGDLHGLNGDVNPIDASIADNPDGAPGSGVDRLQKNAAGARVTLRVVSTAVCAQPDPPPECSIACSDDTACPDGFVCGDIGTCVGECDFGGAPAPLGNMALENHPDIKLSHRLARLQFTIPQSARELRLYELTSFDGELEQEAKAPATTDDGKIIAGPGEGLQIPVAGDCEGSMTSPQCAPYAVTEPGVCANGIDNDGDGDCLDPGDQIEVNIAFQVHDKSYEVIGRAVDRCQARSEPASAQVQTTAINFTTVNACFVATAAYGTPFASEIDALRAFRDGYLLTNAPGRAFVAAYYKVGPIAADVIRDRPWLRSAARVLLTPAVAWARFLTEDSAAK